MLIGLRHGERLYRFATYTGAKVSDLRIDDEHVWLTVDARDGSTLSIRATRPGGAFLHAPIRSQMHKRVEETLQAEVEVTLSDTAGRVLLQDSGHCAGLEVHGETDRLLQMAL